MKDPNFRCLMQANKTVRVELYDTLGPAWAGMIDAKTIAASLQAVGEFDTIELRINSPGGSAFDGIAIHNLLKDHPTKVNVVVDGVAASAASIVAMAGDTVRIPKNALLMIHDPWSMAWGGVEDFQKAINMLGSVKDASVATYAAKSGKTPEQIAQWMSDETWFTGQEAVDNGLADMTEKELPLAKVEPKSQVQSLFQKAPFEFASLVSLSMHKPTKEPLNMDNQTPPVAPPAPPVAEPINQAEVAKTAREEEKLRVQNIHAICNKAGKPELAADFIAKDLSVADVNAKMVEVLCQSRPPVGDEPSADLNGAPDENAKYKAEYAQQKAAYQKAGMSEADYVQSRRIDDGLETLAPSAK